MSQVSKKPRIPLWIFLIILTTGIAYKLISSFTVSGSANTAPLSDSNPSVLARKTVTAAGRVEPMGEVIELGMPEDDRIERILVKEGQKVIKGQKLAYGKRYLQRLAEIDMISARLQEAKAQMAAETEFQTNRIRENEVRLKRLEEILPLQISSQEAEVRKLKSEWNFANFEAERLKSLKDRGITSQQDLDRQSMSAASLHEQLNAASARLEEMKRAQAMDIQLARSGLDTSRAELAKIQSEIKIASLEKEMETASVQLEQAVIRAPRNGEILQIMAHEGEAAGGKPILKFGDTDRMYAAVEVYETDVRWVSIGQKADISSHAFSGSITGTVEYIGRLIAKKDILNIDPASDVDARVVEVKIRLDKSEAVSGLSNMQVDVRIYIGTKT